MTGQRSDLLPRLAGVLWIVLVGGTGIWLSAPRGVVPENAPATQFSAERAMRHIREIARAPHPVGSAEHARVRDYLIAQLSALGLEPAVQKTVGVQPDFGVAATVENILARKRGTAPGPAVLLVAHYDSVPAGPGAGDDGAGVAGLLETARALGAGPPLRHDVMFLFSDGEELGLLGASAFLAEHPWKKDVGAVLNFDNRGTRGAVLMYETSGGNLTLLRDLAAAVPTPRATSLSAAVARLMPNSSDFYLFRKAGLAGMNFAFIGGLENYHTPQDTPANVDLRTLQQCGNDALLLARRLADADLAQFAHSGGSDAIFFNPAGNWLLVYLQSWARRLSFLVLALFLAVAVIGLERGAARLGASLVAFLLCAVSVLAAWRAADWVAVFLPRFHAVHAGPFLFSPLYATALACLAAGLTFAIWELVRFRWEEFALAGAGVWSVAGVALAFLFPEASYLFVWPLVPVLLVLGILFAWSPGNPGCRGLGQLALACLGAVPAVLVIAPLLPSVDQALGISELGAVGQAVVVALSAWLFAAALAPAGVHAEASGRVGRVALLFLSAGAALFAAGLLTVRYNERHPHPEWMAYVEDADHSTAQWLSESAINPFAFDYRHVDPWRAQYLSSDPGLTNMPVPLPFRSSMTCWAHEAPILHLPPPAAELLSDTHIENARDLRILLHFPRGVARVSIRAEANGILSYAMNGHTLTHKQFVALSSSTFLSHGIPVAPRNQREVWTVLYGAPPEEGLEIDARIPLAASLDLAVTGISDGLPAVPGRSFSARPPSVTQQHFTDMTAVMKSFTF